MPDNLFHKITDFCFNGGSIKLKNIYFYKQFNKQDNKVEIPHLWQQCGWLGGKGDESPADIIQGLYKSSFSQ